MLLIYIWEQAVKYFDKTIKAKVSEHAVSRKLQQRESELRASQYKTSNKLHHSIIDSLVKESSLNNK
jgi:protein associated with RNAse G/E